jgi:cephalosporin hydroxylase
VFPLWDVAIAPVLAAARARRVVEIGALRGDTTELMLDFLGPDAELDVIDPAPEFDPSEHEAKFPGRYRFHRDISHNVLPNLGPVDAALIDGDHNWYTVYTELKMLSDASQNADAPLPVLILHDVLWPYGRRDLYYSPDRIPAEHRQPYSQQGIRPGVPEVVSKGGLNPTMWNANVEGGAHNGVMTALDDFIAEYDKPLHRIVVPIYFGLAIVVEEARLARQPELASALRRLEEEDGQRELLEVAEDVRLRAMLYQHEVLYQYTRKAKRGAERYLNLLKGSLLDEHYLENEIRIGYLTSCVRAGVKADPDRLRDPVRMYHEAHSRLLRRRRIGAAPPKIGKFPTFLPYAPMGKVRLEHLEQCLDVVREEQIGGDLVECQTGRGGGAIFMRGYLDAYEAPHGTVWVADEFRASAPPKKEPTLDSDELAGLQADLNLVRDGFERFDLFDDRVKFLQGPLDSVGRAPITEIALLRLGHGIGEDARAVLEQLYPKLAPGGFVIVDDYQDNACEKAVDGFRSEYGITDKLEKVDWTCVTWRKSVEVVDEPAATKRSIASAPILPLAPHRVGAVDLTVVVVFYNMKREAARTLQSLSRVYQEGIDDFTYEVIAVENGSRDDQKLGQEYVESFGPEFRYIDLDKDATPTPVGALNTGIRYARGRAVALMIDGAHILSPGVLRFGLTGLSTYEPAIVVTQQWYLGPGQQGDAMDDGYDQAYEDRLFDLIEWPQAGYRLFEIGNFVGDRDWLDGLWESNCIFVPRKMLEQVGGFDESFSMPGGGFANLEFYERMASDPKVTVVSMLGEGSFHQVHGGVTTNQPDPDERRARVFGYGEHYAETKGRHFRGHGKPIHYIGRIMSPEARRTRPRRLSAELFTRGARPPDPDGQPKTAVPVPQDLREEFVEAVWRSLAWQRGSWLGRMTNSMPTDLMAYQELIARVKPDWIIETGTANGGRTLFLASMCDLLGKGQVVTVNPTLADNLPKHARITYVEADPYEPEAGEKVRKIVRKGKVLTILGSRGHRARTLAAFENFGQLVSVGSYLIVTDTMVNGHPVWTAFGQGPGEAVKHLLNTNGDFVADPELERYSLTFNPGGFLKRIR